MGHTNAKLIHGDLYKETHFFFFFLRVSWQG